MAVTDLTGTKWLFNDVCTSAGASSSFNITYISSVDNEERTSLSSPYLERVYRVSTIMLGYSSSGTYITSDDLIYSAASEGEGWYDTSVNPYVKLSTPPTIEITGGTDVTNSDLITWLEANATQIIDLTAGETYRLKDEIQLLTFDIYGNFNLASDYVDRILFTKKMNGALYALGFYNGSDIVYAIPYSNVQGSIGWGTGYDLGRILTINESLEVPISFLDVFEKMSSPEPSNIFSIGNLPIENIYFGELPVMKVYLGDILIYEAKPVVEDSNFLLNNGDYLYCSNGAIFDTRVISVETAAGEVVTTWGGEDVQVYDE